MRYKVLKDCLSRGGRFMKRDDVFESDGLGRFGNSLLENGFIEKIQPLKLGVVAVSKLAGVEIADQNYVDGDKEYFTFDEALEIEKKLPNGWRLPTRSEWALICEEFGQKDGVLDGDTLKNNLRLESKGYMFGGVVSASGSNGFYWSRTAGGANRAYGLGFNSSIVAMNNYNRHLGFSVRCVRDVRK